MRGLSALKMVVFLLCSATLLSACTLFDKHTYSGLQVNTNDVPSNIFLNDNHIGKSALIEHNLKPGVYSLRITPDDPTYVPHETTITLHSGVLTVVTWKPATKPELSGGVVYELEPLGSKSTEVSFVTVPDNAIVNFGGREKEFSPHVFTDVQAGYTEFEVTLPSYETQKHTIDIIPGYRMHISVKLAKLRSAEEELTNEGIPLATQSAQSSTPSAQLPVVNTTPSTSSQSAKLSPPASASGKVKINPTGYFENNVEVLRVRKEPVNGITLSFIPVGSEVPYLNENKSGWLKIWYDNQEGWVAQQYAQIVE